MERVTNAGILRKSTIHTYNVEREILAGMGIAPLRTIRFNSCITRNVTRVSIAAAPSRVKAASIFNSVRLHIMIKRSL